MQHFQQQGIILDSIPAWSRWEVGRGFSPFQPLLKCLPVFEDWICLYQMETETAGALRAEKTFISRQLHEKITRARNPRHHHLKN